MWILYKKDIKIYNNYTRVCFLLKQVLCYCYSAYLLLFCCPNYLQVLYFRSLNYYFSCYHCFLKPIKNLKLMKMSFLDALYRMMTFVLANLVPASGFQLELLALDWHLNIQELQELQKVMGLPYTILGKTIQGTWGALWSIVSKAQNMLQNRIF